jgi:hypothetical protein
VRNSADPVAGNPFPPGMPQPAIRALVAAGYDRMEQLAGASERALLQLHGVGPKAIRIIKHALEDCGLKPLML